MSLDLDTDPIHVMHVQPVVLARIADEVLKVEKLPIRVNEFTFAGYRITLQYTQGKTPASQSEDGSTLWITGIHRVSDETSR